MKRKYELSTCIFIMCGSYVFLLISFFVYLVNCRLVVFKNYAGVVADKDVLEFVLTNKELKDLYKNKVIYIKQKKYKYTINEVAIDDIKTDDDSYKQVFLNVSLDGNYKINDVINVSIMERSIKGINLFRVIWR